MNVYNIVWADDEIDIFLDNDYEEDLLDIGIKIIGKARNGIELEKCLEKENKIDAIIVDANFNETTQTTSSERDISGLVYARSLYLHKLEKKVPFFLFTNRTDELLKEITKDNPSFLDDFPRHKRWFSKYHREERDEMFTAIKDEVDKLNSPNFIVRNRYEYELNAANMINGAHDFVFEFLVKDLEGKLDEMVEPFVRQRRIIEKLFGLCEEWKIIPPISDDTNGTANYFLHNSYCPKQTSGIRQELYRMSGGDIMPKPLAQSLSYIVNVTQDGSHSKEKLKLKVDRYFEKTKDTLLLRSVSYILIDIIKWFVITLLQHQDKEVNEAVLWAKCK